MTSSSTFSSCWTSWRARSSAMLDRSRSSNIAPLAPGEGGGQTASYYVHFPSLWQPIRAWTFSLGRCFKAVDPVSEGKAKFITIDEQPNHQVVHLFRLGEAQRAAYKPLDPGPQI